MRIQLLGLAVIGLLATACAPVEPMPTGDGPSQCKADQYQRYVGRHRSELPAEPEGAVWRVTCTTCPMTMDYNPGRLNVLFDESSGVIREVKCG